MRTKGRTSAFRIGMFVGAALHAAIAVPLFLSVMRQHATEFSSTVRLGPFRMAVARGWVATAFGNEIRLQRTSGQRGSLRIWIKGDATLRSPSFESLYRANRDLYELPFEQLLRVRTEYGLLLTEWLIAQDGGKHVAKMSGCYLLNGTTLVLSGYHDLAQAPSELRSGLDLGHMIRTITPIPHEA
ncbi:MAG: hypothetical protein DYH07_11185 [Armatimonadetes bacterium ATM1]|nr:MAG: hypothetical protein EDM73_11345 [Armatimonadota bacterium]MBC6970237.1 hypothetical protein [Armatimonadota bacterium]MCE7900639.1 hypothetical protein [Armatimonadetes bacterium ATM1]RIJ97180.1 MAG: hypothetical protein DCC45_03850 [Armatimonadota bacterium]